MPNAITSSYIKALDGLRAFAVAIVVYGHLGEQLEKFGYDVGPAFKFAKAPGLGVDLFFVLSGFLITSILFEIKSRDGSMSAFWIRRVLRLTPVYFLYLFVLLGLTSTGYAFTPGVATSISAFEWLGLFLYLGNFFVLTHGPAPTEFVLTWSLAVEEQFYLIWPWLVRDISHLNLRNVLFVAFALSVASRAFLFSFSPDSEGFVFLLFCRMDGLLLGGLIALSRTYDIGTRQIRWLGNLWPIGLLTLVFLMQYKFIFWDQSTLTITSYYAVVSIAWTTIVVRVLKGGKGVDALLSNRAARFFGKTSYSMYLWHTLAGGAALWALHEQNKTLPVDIVCVLAAALTATSVSYFFIEKPTMKLKKHFPYFQE